MTTKIIKNNLLLKAIKGEMVEKTPVWLMRQAGRILPEYRLLRKKVPDFKTLVQTPDLACEATLQPLKVLDVDAAIIFSDILVIPQAMGLNYQMIEDKGPFFEKTIETIDDIEKLDVSNIEAGLNFVSETIKLVKKELDGKLPVIGFAGAPWTIFAYMIEGHGSKNFSKAKKFLFHHPDYSHKLLEKITQSTIRYLKLQIKSGADVLQIFDSWAGVLSPDSYKTFALPYLAKICHAINEVPVIVFARGAFYALKDIKEINCKVIGLDWTMDILEAKRIIGNDKCLQGNLDPCLLYADFSTIRKETCKMLHLFGPKKYIANLGHGVNPDTELDKVKCFIETVNTFKFESAIID